MTTTPIRRGTAADADTAARVLAEAFAEDPYWGWALPTGRTRPADTAPVWAIWVRGAIANDGLWVTPGCEAVSLWTPPECPELVEGDEEPLERLIAELAGDRAADVLASMHQFEAAHPSAPPHHYLGLLGTDPAHRGHGLGMALVEAVLERIDAEGAPAYLESTNPAANDARYERVGFERHGQFTAEAAGVTVHTMWRPARA